MKWGFLWNMTMCNDQLLGSKVIAASKLKLLKTLQRLPLYWRAYRSSRSSNGSRSKQQQQFGGCNYEDQASLWRSREAPVSSKTAVVCGRRRRRCTAAQVRRRREPHHKDGRPWQHQSTGRSPGVHISNLFSTSQQISTKFFLLLLQISSVKR